MRAVLGIGTSEPERARRFAQVGETVADGALRPGSTHPLSPVTWPGMPWRRHRHWLQLDAWYIGGPDAFLIVNQRTGRSYRFSYLHTRTGETRFFVPTRYALLFNRRWREDPWTFHAFDPAREEKGNRR
jgi:hypothetical protein